MRSDHRANNDGDIRMTAFLSRPLDFTVSSSGNASSVCLPIHANDDDPTMVYRSASTSASYVILDMGSAASYDSVSVIGSNLRASDTIRVRTGSSNTGVGGYDSTALAAFTGFKDSNTKTKSIFRIGSTTTNRYVRIDFTSGGHPDGYVEVQRFVVGPSIEFIGITRDAGQSFEDPSISYSGPGFTKFDRHATMPSWKVKTAHISDTDYRQKWRPFFTAVGQNVPIVFTPRVDEADKIQSECVFGCISSAPKTDTTRDRWNIELNITGSSA